MCRNQAWQHCAAHRVVFLWGLSDDSWGFSFSGELCVTKTIRTQMNFMVYVCVFLHLLEFLFDTFLKRKSMLYRLDSFTQPGLSFNYSKASPMIWIYLNNATEGPRLSWSRIFYCAHIADFNILFVTFTSVNLWIPYLMSCQILFSPNSLPV